MVNWLMPRLFLFLALMCLLAAAAGSYIQGLNEKVEAKTRTCTAETVGTPSCP